MERSLYESRLKAARDKYAQMKWAKKSGLLEGIEKGETIGMKKGREELFALLESGVSLADAKKMFNRK